MKGGNPRISVVVASYNQENTISACIASLLKQRTNVKYEVIVVDSSTNSAAHIAESFAQKIRLIRRKQRTSWGVARNIGRIRAKGRIIAFTDTDCVVDEQWISGLSEAHKKHDAVGGRIINGNPGSLLGWSMFFTEFAEFIGTKERTVPNVSGCNVSYKKNIFEKYGALPENQWSGLWDDIIFNYRIKEKLFFSPRAVVKHINKTKFSEIVRHSYFAGFWGAHAAAKDNVPGKWVVKCKLAIPLLFFYRLLKIGRCTLGSRYFLFFILASPFTLIVLLSWTWGYLMGALKYG